MESGKIHIYCGDGKGKSTAAAGLAMRCAGSGRKVLFVQFLKDGTSSETALLKCLPGVEVLHCERNYGFTFSMTEAEWAEAAKAYEMLMELALEKAVNDHADLLVMDEFLSVYNTKMIDRKTALEFLCEKPGHLEVVLTGRNPREELIRIADYVTEMKKIRHPYEEQGLPAREGIEY